MKTLFISLLLLSVPAFAGTNNLPIESGSVIQRQHINKFQTALSGDLVPRDASGVVGDVSGSLGESSYRWLNVFTKNLSLLFGSGGNAITLGAPSSVPSPYPITFPSALPSSRQYLSIETSGVIFTSPVASIGTTQTFTAGGTYTTATGTTLLLIEGCGAGGGGSGGAGGSPASGGGGGGGGGGGYSRLVLPVTAGQVFTISVSAGGTYGAGGGLGLNGGIAFPGADSTVTISGVYFFIARGGYAGAPGIYSGSGGSGGVETQKGYVGERGCYGGTGGVASSSSNNGSNGETAYYASGNGGAGGGASGGGGGGGGGGGWVDNSVSGQSGANGSGGNIGSPGAGGTGYCAGGGGGGGGGNSVGGRGGAGSPGIIKFTVLN